MTKKPITHKVFPIHHCRCGKLPLIVTGANWAHRHLNHANPGAKIATETLKVVSDAAMVPTTIRDLLQRGETEYPDALETFKRHSRWRCPPSSWLFPGRTHRLWRLIRPLRSHVATVQGAATVIEHWRKARRPAAWPRRPRWREDRSAASYARPAVVIVSEMYDDEHNVIAGVVAVALAHALPIAVPRRRVADGVETVSVSSACGAAAVRENLIPKKRSEVGHG